MDSSPAILDVLSATPRFETATLPVPQSFGKEVKVFDMKSMDFTTNAWTDQPVSQKAIVNEPFNFEQAFAQPLMNDPDSPDFEKAFSNDVTPIRPLEMVDLDDAFSLNQGTPKKEEQGKLESVKSNEPPLIDNTLVPVEGVEQIMALGFDELSVVDALQR